MSGSEVRFTDGGAYERYMGPWTRLVGPIFLEWISVPAGQRWLEVGCGTGMFTELLLRTTAPSEVIAIDPAPAQIEHAKTKPFAQEAKFEIADAQALPFQDAEFDVVTSALVINFIPDRARAVAEMKRVVKPGGWVTGYVWDFAGELSVTRHTGGAIREINPDLPPVFGSESSRIGPLGDLFRDAGLQQVSTKAIEVEYRYRDFDDYWTRFIENPTPMSIFAKSLNESQREDLRLRVHARLPIAADHSISIVSRANAVRGLVAGSPAR